MNEHFWKWCRWGKARVYRSSSCNLETTSVVPGKFPEQYLGSSTTIISTIEYNAYQSCCSSRLYRTPVAPDRNIQTQVLLVNRTFWCYRSTDIPSNLLIKWIFTESSSGVCDSQTVRDASHTSWEYHQTQVLLDLSDYYRSTDIPSNLLIKWIFAEYSSGVCDPRTVATFFFYQFIMARDASHTWEYQVFDTRERYKNKTRAELHVCCVLRRVSYIYLHCSLPLDLFFYSASYNQPMDGSRAGLPSSVHTVDGLGLHRGIQEGLQHEHVVCFYLRKSDSTARSPQ